MQLQIDVILLGSDASKQRNEINVYREYLSGDIVETVTD